MYNLTKGFLLFLGFSAQENVFWIRSGKHFIVGYLIQKTFRFSLFYSEGSHFSTLESPFKSYKVNDPYMLKEILHKFDIIIELKGTFPRMYAI